MNFKEAFRYQSKLSEWIRDGTTMLYLTRFITVVDQTHHKKDGDETIYDVYAPERELTCEPQQVVYFVQFLIDHKKAVSTSIRSAKMMQDVDIDALPANNELLRNFAKACRSMCAINKTTKKTRDSDYCFNSEGEQKPYSYVVDETTAPRFDKGIIAVIAKNCESDADKISTMIDEAMVNGVVHVNPLFDVNDTFAQAMETYANLQENQ